MKSKIMMQTNIIIYFKILRGGHASPWEPTCRKCAMKFKRKKDENHRYTYINLLEGRERRRQSLEGQKDFTVIRAMFSTYYRY